MKQNVSIYYKYYGYNTRNKKDDFICCEIPDCSNRMHDVVKIIERRKKNEGHSQEDAILNLIFL